MYTGSWNPACYSQTSIWASTFRSRWNGQYIESHHKNFNFKRSTLLSDAGNCPIRVRTRSSSLTWNVWGSSGLPGRHVYSHLPNLNFSSTWSLFSKVPQVLEKLKTWNDVKMLESIHIFRVHMFLKLVQSIEFQCHNIWVTSPYHPLEALKIILTFNFLQILVAKNARPLIGSGWSFWTPN